MDTSTYDDWGNVSETFDQIRLYVNNRDLVEANEAQTRFDVIDRLIREVLGWHYGQITVEEPNEGERIGYVDYILRSGDYTIVIEAKRAGASFPSPTKKPKLKLSGSVLSIGDIGQAIKQAEEYAKTKQADVVVVTNGLCWCFYSLLDRDDDSYASLLFPFIVPGHAEQLFNRFSLSQVLIGSLEQITNRLPPMEDRLLSVVRNADGRVDRNNIADHITPALNNALYADALLSSPDHLERCFVSTDARTKFDTFLGMYLADPKPELVTPARRIRKDKAHDHIEQIVTNSEYNHAPPVTLIIGPVGAGKSTYLKHFELIAGREVLQKQKAHWIYIDFEEMGKAGFPRQFIYAKLREYLLADHSYAPTDYKHVIEPAYEEEIAALARGPYAPIFTNKEEFKKKVVEHISKDFDAVEPYVDKIFRYIANTQLCVVVLDNIDLYEDDALETSVFAEGLALSKRIFCNVIVSIRDKTFVRHRTDSTFDAYELRKLWLDPPPFKAVLSSRLSYSKKILENVPAKIALENGMQLVVPDLSIFFDIVQKSILSGQAGEYIEYVSDLNIRKGLALVTNFLTSGHIQADRAIKTYIEGDNYAFPFHEIFKGSMLGQWRYFREDRSECVNIFDARLGARRLRLLRLLLLNHLLIKAQHEQSLEVPIADCILLFSNCGASEIQVIDCLSFLYNRGLIRNVTAEDLDSHSTIVVTKSGGYYAKILSKKLIYVEECMFDTAIEDFDVWQVLSDLTVAIEGEPSIATRMELRRERIKNFLDYQSRLESEILELVGTSSLASMDQIKASVLQNADEAVAKSKRYYQ
ncbi:MAG TPA: hypothetical protein VEP90_19760 [Methylomirabilota bacterium]|nr:hypothetical protein [Methylomirabilota bacterium]